MVNIMEAGADVINDPNVPNLFLERDRELSTYFDINSSDTTGSLTHIEELSDDGVGVLAIKAGQYEEKCAGLSKEMSKVSLENRTAKQNEDFQKVLLQRDICTLYLTRGNLPEETELLRVLNDFYRSEGRAEIDEQFFRERIQYLKSYAKGKAGKMELGPLEQGTRFSGIDFDVAEGIGTGIRSKFKEGKLNPDFDFRTLVPKPVPIPQTVT